jgi:predicted nuclease of predicted toxin-antitoxin system
MKPRFLIDAQLPPALADQLLAQGYHAEHVVRIGLGTASDKAIWEQASRSDMVLITKDEDFVSGSWASALKPQVIWIRLGNTTNRVLWRAFQESLPEVLQALEAGERVIEIVSRDYNRF